MDLFLVKPLLTSDLAWMGWATAAVFSIALAAVLGWISHVIGHQSRMNTPRAAPFRRVRTPRKRRVVPLTSLRPALRAARS